MSKRTLAERMTGYAQGLKAATGLRFDPPPMPVDSDNSEVKLPQPKAPAASKIRLQLPAAG